MRGDEIIIYEVMMEEPNREWCGQYRAELEQPLRQERLLVQATAVEPLSWIFLAESFSEHCQTLWNRTARILLPLHLK